MRLLPFTLGVAAFIGAGFVAPPVARPAPEPAVEGAWSSVMQWPMVAVHAHLLPTGEVLVWNRGMDRHTESEARIWDWKTGQFTAHLAIDGTNIFCTGHAFLGDGRLLVAGGHITDQVGTRDLNLFDPFTQTWTRGPLMNAGRWYPTVTTLPSGEALVVGGEINLRKGHNHLPQAYTLGGQWRNLTRAARFVPNYSFMHVGPDGRVFNSGPLALTRYLDTSGTGRWTTVGKQVYPGRYRRQAVNRRDGSSVLYAEGKVLVTGGDDPPTNTAEVIDLTHPTPQWRAVAPMTVARRLQNMTLLPDGKVFVSGGSSGRGSNNEQAAVLHSEIWDPQTEQFSPMASMAVPRVYHSTALLLPDGSVLSAGGGEGRKGINRLNAEIYYPPYLFRGERPTIAAAPEEVRYGETFFVHSEDAPQIGEVTWVRLSSVTHGFNMNQRLNRLQFQTDPGGLVVTAPANPNACPPGHYLLFILNNQGVPSEARIVRIS